MRPLGMAASVRRGRRIAYMAAWLYPLADVARKPGELAGHSAFADDEGNAGGTRARPGRRALPRRPRAGGRRSRSGSACRGRRCGSRSRPSPTRGCSSRSAAAGSSFARSRAPTSPTRSSFAGCSRAWRRGSPPSGCARGTSSSALAEATAQLDEVVDDLSPESLVRYVELNDAYHHALVALAESEVLERAIANVVVLPFASPGALVASQAVLPRSREILDRRPAPAPRPPGCHRQRPGRPRRGDRPRACAARAAQPRPRPRGPRRTGAAAGRAAPPARRLTPKEACRTMSQKSLEDALQAAGSPVELARNSQIGPYVYPAVPAEFSNWRDEQVSWRETCALFDQSHHMTDLYVEGPDTIRLLSDLGVNTFANFAVEQGEAVRRLHTGRLCDRRRDPLLPRREPGLARRAPVGAQLGRLPRRDRRLRRQRSSATSAPPSTRRAGASSTASRCRDRPRSR